MSDRDRYLESAGGRFVHLPGGLCLPVEPILLALEIEARGLRLRRDGEDICITPRSRLSDEDRAALRRWKVHVLALLDYVDQQEALQ